MRVMKQRSFSANTQKTQEKWLSSMAPTPEWRESATRCGSQDRPEAMGARSCVRRVPWHPTQPHDLRQFIAAAPVRTVHYNTAKAVRAFLRSDFIAALPRTGRGAALSRHGEGSCLPAGGTPARSFRCRTEITDDVMMPPEFAPDPGDCEQRHIPRYWGRRADHLKGRWTCPR